MDGQTTERDCRFYRPRLHAYIEGALDASTARFVSAHIRRCSDCHLEKTRLETERIELLESFFALPALPADFPARVRQAAEDDRSRSPLLNLRFVSGAAAGLLLGALAVTAVFLSLGERDVPLRVARTDTPLVSPAPEPVPVERSRPVEIAEAEEETPPAETPDESAGGESEPVEVIAARSPAAAPAARLREHLDHETLTETINSFPQSGPCAEDVNGDGMVGPSDVALIACVNLSPFHGTVYAQTISGDCDDCLY